MTNSAERLPTSSENNPEKHSLEPVKVGSEIFANSTETIVGPNDKPLLVEPFNQDNINAVLLKLISDNEKDYQSILNNPENTDPEKKAKKTEQPTKKIKMLKELMTKLQSAFSTSKNEIFFVKKESTTDIIPTPILCMAITANQNEKLQNDLKSNFRIKSDGNKGFHATAIDDEKVVLYFIFGKEQHKEENPQKEEKPKQAA
jgi:hypothetical protein